MTIVAGFKCWEGVVLCADTQETVSDISKKNVPKLIFQPVDSNGHALPSNKDQLAVAFCGSSNNAAFVDKLVASAWEDAQAGRNLDEVCNEIEKSIKNTYREFGKIFQTGYCPGADLLYGVKMFGHSKLFSASGPVVNEVHTYASAGAGYYMADFLASRMYGHHLDIRQCVILAAYILYQAGEYVVGCGGDSQIAVLKDDGTSGVVDSKVVDELTKTLQFVDKELWDFTLAAANLSLTTEELREGLDNGIDMLILLRDVRKKELERHMRADEELHRKLFNKEPPTKDDLGLPMPPSEPQT